MGTGQEVDDDGLIKSLLRCHEFKKRARKQVFHNKTFYRHIMKVHIMRQDIRKEIESTQEQQRLEEQHREERRQLDLQEQQQIEYQKQLELQQYQNQLAFEQQQQQQQQQHQQQQQELVLQQQVQHSEYQIFQNQMPHQLAGYQDQYQYQYQQVEPHQQFQVQQDYQKPMNYMQYSHGDYGYEETSVKLEQRISSLESLETPPPSDLPSHPPPSLSSISSSSFTDNTTATLSSMYNTNIFAPTETPATSSADQAMARGSRASSGFGSSAGSSQSSKNACSPPNQLTLKFPMQLPQSAAADVDIMRRNLWLMIVRKEIPQARKRKMSFKDQKRTKTKTVAHRAVSFLKEFRRRVSLKAEKMSKIQAIVNEVQPEIEKVALA